MAGSNFYFIRDLVLRQNLDDALNHVVTLLPFAESKTYNETAKSSFRKTIIIYTASIIEALLFHVVDLELNEEALSTSSWEILNKKTLHRVSDNHEIIAGDYKIKVKKIKKDKLNFGNICDILRDNRILTEPLLGEVNIIRELRNSQHIGPTKKVKSFSKKDLENAFSVASDVKNFVKARV